MFYFRIFRVFPIRGNLNQLWYTLRRIGFGLRNSTSSEQACNILLSNRIIASPDFFRQRIPVQITPA